jgi:hypothetical protein
MSHIWHDIPEAVTLIVALEVKVTTGRHHSGEGDDISPPILDIFICSLELGGIILTDFALLIRHL